QAWMVRVVRSTHHEGAQRPELGLDRVGPGSVGRGQTQLDLVPSAELAIAAYLDAVGPRLVGTRRTRRADLAELRDGLHEAAATHHRRGVPAAEAVAAALRE